jgi:hypothetical protein
MIFHSTVLDSLAQHHNRLAVLGDDGKPLGIMTRVDVFGALAR